MPATTAAGLDLTSDQRLIPGLLSLLFVSVHCSESENGYLLRSMRR